MDNYDINEYQEDQSALREPVFDIEPDWYLELDLISQCID